MIQVYRGEVYLATLLGEGCEQKGTRPVLIIQNNVGNRFIIDTSAAKKQDFKIGGRENKTRRV